MLVVKFNHGGKGREEYVTFIGINQEGSNSGSSESRWRQEGKWDCRERRVWKHKGVRKVQAGSKQKS